MARLAITPRQSRASYNPSPAPTQQDQGHQLRSGKVIQVQFEKFTKLVRNKNIRAFYGV